MDGRASILISFAPERRRPRGWTLRFVRAGLDHPMRTFWRSWTHSDEWFGNLAVIGFMLVQYLDGFYTYAGFSIWGLNIEANPLIRSAVAFAGPATGLAVAKLVAIGFGALLHLRRVHMVVAILTGIYIVLSIVPWTALLFLS